MKRGEKLWVRDAGEWVEATYEFHCIDQEPLGHHSVMLANGGGRRVVCGCKTSTAKPDERWADAHIADAEIVIRVGISALPTALEANPRDDTYSKCKVTDLPAFAGEVVRKLNSEFEDGTTAIHLMLDQAMADAIDDGCEGIEYQEFER